MGICLVVARAPAAAGLRGNLGIHDPSTIIKCKDRYYIFGTGQGIPVKWSTDKVLWNAGPKVFASAPAWTTNAAPGFDGTIWAPDIVYLNGKYCLYYAVSSWASQVSAIGLTTNPKLDPTDPNYRWTDQGIVIQSTNGSPYNTIDPSVTLDGAGNPWMSFGSYWSGIYVVQLDPLTGLRVASNSPVTRVAYNSSIEASCLYRRGGYFYLFVNWGSCCSGVNSTYHIRVGRSTSPTGPFLDRNGVDMAANGGTLFLQGTGKFTGPGHVGVLSENGAQSFSYHYYDAGAYAPWYGAYGVADFDLQPLTWTTDDWPVFTNDWSAVYHFQSDARDENGQYYGLLLNGVSITNDAVHGRVLNLSGTNQYIRLPAGVGFARTFAAVVKWGGGAAWQRIFDFGTDTSSYVMLTSSSGNGRLRCDIRANGTTQTLEATAPLPVGVWTHVALTLDGSKGVLYVNGSPLATNSSMTLSPLDAQSETNHLGHSKFSADPDFKGQIACFRVHGRALSAAEIAAPNPAISQPADGATYRPGDKVFFAGSATDFFDSILAPASLAWTVKWINSGTTNVILASSGVTNGMFMIPSGGALATNGLYQISLAATDASGRKGTNSVSVFPLGAAGAATDWASFYPFTTGAQDASNRFNGTLLGGASIQNDGVRGKVLNLSGGSQYASLPAGAGGAQTISGWVKWSGGNAWQRIFDFGQNNNDWLFLSPLDADGKMQVAITTDRANYVQVIQSASPLPVGLWTHFAVVFDGRQGMLYTNGVLAAVNHSVNLLPSDLASSKCYLGRSQYTPDPYFSGQIDSLRLNSRALSPAEIVAPSPVVTQPASGALYAGGDAIAFAGSATDYSDSPLPASAFSWSAEFRHDGSIDPVFGPTMGITNGAFLISTNGPLSTNVFYRLSLLATDNIGNQQRVSTDILPRLNQVNFTTVPAGLLLALDGQPMNTPTSVVTVAGMNRTLSAPSPQSLAGSNYSFVAWSDGGATTHNFSVPLNASNYTASFVLPTLGLRVSGTNLTLTWPDWAAASFTPLTATNLAAPVNWFALSAAPQLTNGSATVTLPVTNGARFFRLARP